MDTDNWLHRYTALPFAIDYLHTKELALPSPKNWDDRNDSFYIEKFIEAENLSDAFALCLTDSPETYHHWRVFSGGPSGVCIEFDRDRLIKAANKIQGLRAEPVIYRTIDHLKLHPPHRTELPFLKRLPFKDEREFRLFICVDKPISGLYRVHVPVAAVNKIKLSPWLDPAVADRIKKLLKSIPGCKNIRIFRSTLVQNERWKRFGTKNV